MQSALRSGDAATELRAGTEGSVPNRTRRIQVGFRLWVQLHACVQGKQQPLTTTLSRTLILHATSFWNRTLSSGPERCRSTDCSLTPGRLNPASSPPRSPRMFLSWRKLGLRFGICYTADGCVTSPPTRYHKIIVQDMFEVHLHSLQSRKVAAMTDKVCGCCVPSPEFI